MKVRVNLEPETRSGYYVDEKMKKVWNIELDLLEKLIEVCNKYNLKCYADAGTLLGAVRHKGFIPWDDDIDVVMFREDYDKLLEIAKDEFTHPYFLQTAYSDIEYIRGHAQLRNSETTAILDRDRDRDRDINAKFNQGIFIDIFVLDAVTDNKNKLKIQKFKIDCIKKILLKKYVYGNNSKTIRGKFFYYFVNVLLKIIPYQKFFKKTEDILRREKIENCNNVAPLNFIFETEKRIRSKNLYNETILLDFEKIQIPAPTGYEEFLTKRYGDYMKPSKVPTTHGGVFFDPDVSYKEYIGK